MSLDQYLKIFSRLRTDKNRKRWSALINHQAPHKSFLMLSIIDLIAQGSITQPSIFLRYLLQITAPPKPLIREYQQNIVDIDLITFIMIYLYLQG